MRATTRSRLALLGRIIVAGAAIGIALRRKLRASTFIAGQRMSQVSPNAS
jgi:hypothetical protein